MPDMICPPLWTKQGSEHPCSCRGLRYGVFLLALCGYSAALAPVFFGKPFAAVVGAALDGAVPFADKPILWSSIALLGLVGVGVSLRRIYAEAHGFKAGSFVWSVLVVAACAWRLKYLPNCIGQAGWFGWTITASDFHLLRMFFVAWLASNAANIALNLFEVWRRRARAPRRYYPASQPMQHASGLLRRRTVTTAWVEEIEGLPEHLLTGARSAAHHAPPHIAPDLLDHLGDVPLIDLVPQGDGSFIPLDLRDGEPVPVRRRR
jgi:hypothetical protein